MIGIIYKLSSPDGKFYIGSTTMGLRERVWRHKARAKIDPSIPVYKHFNSVGWDSVSASVLKQGTYSSKKELLLEESKLYDKVKGSAKCLNRQAPIEK